MSNSNSNPNSNLNKENEVNRNLNTSTLSQSHRSSGRHGNGNNNGNVNKGIGLGMGTGIGNALGSDAASSYFFSDVPKTPAVKKELKRQRQRQRRELRLQQSSTKSARKTRNGGGDANVNANNGPNNNANVNNNTNTNAMDDTEDLQLLLMEESNDGDESMLLSPPPPTTRTPPTTTTTTRTPANHKNDIAGLSGLWNDSTFNSVASSSVATSSDGYGDGDLLNKSVLSDTTELTASNYVFAASSRHRLEETTSSMMKSIAKLVGTQQQQQQHAPQQRQQQQRQDEAKKGEGASMGGDDDNDDDDDDDNDDEQKQTQKQRHALNQSMDTMDISKLLEGHDDDNYYGNNDDNDDNHHSDDSDDSDDENSLPVETKEFAMEEEDNKDGDDDGGQQQQQQQQQQQKQQRHAVNQSMDTMDISKLLDESSDDYKALSNSGIGNGSGSGNSKLIMLAHHQRRENNDNDNEEEEQEDHTIDTAMLDQFIDLDESTDDLRNESVCEGVGVSAGASVSMNMSMDAKVSMERCNMEDEDQVADVDTNADADADADADVNMEAHTHTDTNANVTSNTVQFENDEKGGGEHAEKELLSSENPEAPVAAPVGIAMESGGDDRRTMALSLFGDDDDENERSSLGLSLSSIRDEEDDNDSSMAEEGKKEEEEEVQKGGEEGDVVVHRHGSRASSMLVRAEDDEESREEPVHVSAPAPAPALTATPIAAPPARTSIFGGGQSIVSSSSPFLNTSMKLNVPLTWSRRRRSRIGGIENGGEESAFQQSARRVRASIASIQKARHERESMKKRQYARLPRSSIATSSGVKSSRFPLPGSATPLGLMSRTSPVAEHHHEPGTNEGADESTTAESVEEKSASGSENQAVDTTVDFAEHKINEILGDLVPNSDSGDEVMEHATPEKLNMSILQDIVPSTPPRADGLHESAGRPPTGTPKSASNRTRPRTPSISDNETLANLRVYNPSPARNTRLRVQKRKSLGLEIEEFESLPMGKRHDRKDTPQKRGVGERRMSISSTNSSMLSPGEDDTQAYLEYVVPHFQVESSYEDMNEDDTRNAVLAPVKENLGDSTMGSSDPMNPLDSDKSLAVSSSSDDTETMCNQSQVQDLPMLSGGKMSADREQYPPISNASKIDEKETHLGGSGMDKDILLFEEDGANVLDKGAKSVIASSAQLPSPAKSDASSSSVDTNILLKSFSKTSGTTESIKKSDLSETNSIHSPGSKKQLFDVDETGGALKSAFAPPPSMKSHELNITSPLSGDESNEKDNDIDTISSVSPSTSSTSSEESSAINGDNGDTANSQDLRDIMADLDKDLDMPTNEARKKKRRRSSTVFRLSLSSDTQDFTKPSGHLEVATADTQDIKGLFKSLESRQSSSESRTSSLLPIEENTPYESEEKSSDEDFAPRSPDPPGLDFTKTQTPKSILKKKRVSETPKRNVAFYPPVAAEYNVGSPPTNFTPLCTSITKTLFTIPSIENEESRESESIMSDDTSLKDETVDLESNMAGLADAIVHQKPSSNESQSTGVLSTSSDGPGIDNAKLEAETTGLLDVVVAGESGRSEESSLLYDSSISRDESKRMSLCNSSVDNKEMEPELTGLSNIETKGITVKEDKRLSGISLQSSYLGGVEKGNENSDKQSDLDTKTARNESNTSSSRSFFSLNSKHDGLSAVSTDNLDNTMSTISSLSSSEMSRQNQKTTELVSDLQQMIEEINQSVACSTKSSVTIQSEVTNESSVPSVSSLATIEDGTMTLELNMKDMHGQTDPQTINLERNMEDMLKHLNSDSKSQEEVNTNTYEEAMSFGEASMLQSSASDSITEDFRLLANRASNDAQKSRHEETTISLGDNSILKKAEGDNIELEVNMEGLVGKVSGQETSAVFADASSDSSSNIKSVEEFLGQGNAENSANFADISSNVSSNIKSVDSSLSETNKLMRSMERMIENDATTASSTGIKINISPISRDSGNEDSRLVNAIPSSDMSSEVAKLFQESDPEKSTGEIQSEVLDEKREKVVDLKWKEVADAISSTESVHAHTNNLFTEAEIALKVYNHPSLRDQAKQYIIQAIEEMERSDDENIDPNTLLTDLLEADNLEADLSNLQEALRGDMENIARSKHIEKLRVLDDASHKMIEMDVTSWEAEILDMMHKSVGNMLPEAEEDMQVIEKKLNELCDVEKYLLSHQAARKAKNQITQKKKNQKKELEETIRQFDLSLSQEGDILRQQMNENARVKALLKDVEESKSLQSKIAKSRPDAESLWENTKILEGTSSWKLTYFDGSRITVEFKSNIPQLSFGADFKKASSGAITCEFHELTQKMSSKSQSKYRKNSKFTSNILAFFSDKVEILQSDLKKKVLKSIVDVRETIQHIEWYLGRLDIVGKELSILELRHSGKLMKSGSSHDFSLSIRSRSKARVVNVKFRIDDSYPFAISETGISGDANIGSLKRYLVKKDKPGFGYLSRTCDEITAFLEM